MEKDSLFAMLENPYNVCCIETELEIFHVHIKGLVSLITYCT